MTMDCECAIAMGKGKGFVWYKNPGYSVLKLASSERRFRQ